MALAVAFMAAHLVATVRRAMRRGSQDAAGVERLAPGATGWQPLPAPGGDPVVTRIWRGADGRALVATRGSLHGACWQDGAWVATTEAPPRAPKHPDVPDTSWLHLGGEEWLVACADSCAPVLEPAKTALPPVPKSTPERFRRCLRAAARTTTGDLLVAVDQPPELPEDPSKRPRRVPPYAMRLWKLPPGGEAWVDLGPLPTLSRAVQLVPGLAGDVLLVDTRGRMARLEGERWTVLPAPKSSRLGWMACQDVDGAVIAGGGIVDTGPRDKRVSAAITLSSLAGLALAVALGARVLALAGGVVVGLLVSAVGVIALWFAARPRL